MSYKDSEKKQLAGDEGGVYRALLPVPIKVLRALLMFVNPHKDPVTSETVDRLTFPRAQSWSVDLTRVGGALNP